MMLHTQDTEGTKNPLDGFLDNKVSKYQPFLVGFSFVVLAALIINTLYGTESFTNWYYCVSILFMGDLCYRFSITDSRKEFILDYNNWIDLALCLPFYTLPWIVTTATLRSLKNIIGFILHRVKSAFHSMLILGGALMIFSSISIMQFEIEDACNIKNIYDAMWWSICTITTVGFGDKFPITDGGRMVAIILMVLGIGLFGALVGYISNFFTEKEKENNTTIDTIEELSQQLQLLREELKNKKNEL